MSRRSIDPKHGEQGAPSGMGAGSARTRNLLVRGVLLFLRARAAEGSGDFAESATESADALEAMVNDHAQLVEALKPFAQLTALGREDALPDETILAVHLFNVHRMNDMDFGRHQKPYASLTLGHLRALRAVLASVEGR